MDILSEKMFNTPAPAANTAVAMSIEVASKEVERYRKEHLGINANPLQWWKSNQSAFPTISPLAKKHLCVAGTSVPSERLFSAAGNLLSAKRSCLDSQNVVCMLFLNKNM